MADYKVTSRYALSLLETANEKNILDVVSKDMEFIVSVIASHNQLKLMLGSPVIKSKLKKSILDEIFKEKVSEDSLKFILFVLEKNREKYLPDIARKFLELKDEYLGIVHVDVRTSQKFSDEQSNQLKDRFEKLLNKKVQLNFKIDDSVIGGFVAKVGDTVYDASISHQLDILKKQFVEGGALLN